MSQRTMTIEELRAEAAAERAAGQKKPRRCDLFCVTTATFRFRLPFPPALNHYYIHRRMPIGGWRRGDKRIAICPEGIAYRREVESLWERHVGRLTFKGRVAIRMFCVFPDERIRDLDGLEKCFFDSLQHAGAFANDSQIKLKISEQELVIAPGWIDLTIGPKPQHGTQGTLFDVEF